MSYKYIIQDWAGNDLSSYYGTFDTFEDAWDAILERFKDLDESELENQLQEFEVVVSDSPRYNVGEEW